MGKTLKLKTPLLAGFLVSLDIEEGKGVGEGREMSLSLGRKHWNRGVPGSELASDSSMGKALENKKTPERGSFCCAA